MYFIAEDGRGLTIFNFKAIVIFFLKKETQLHFSPNFFFKLLVI